MTGGSRGTIVLATTVDQSLKLMRGHPAHLDEAGWDVHVVSSGDSGRAPDFYLGPMPESVHFHRIPTAREPSPRSDLASLRGWLRLLRRVKPDVVLLGTPKASMLGLTAARFVRVPTRIYLIRGFRFEGASGLSRRVFTWLERWSAAMATHVVAVSPSLRELALESRVGGRAGVDVLGPGSSNGIVIPTVEHRQQLLAAKTKTLRGLGLDLGVPVIGYVGRITGDKGVEVLAKACAQLMSDSVAHQLVLVGDEDDPGFLEQVTRILDAASVRYALTGYVSEPAAVMASMDVFCLPSFREGMPNVALEAASLGLPVVTTDATGCRDGVVPGTTGELVGAGDVRELTEALELLLSDQSRREALGDAGAVWVAESFERTKVWDRWDAYLKIATAGGVD